MELLLGDMAIEDQESGDVEELWKNRTDRARATEKPRAVGGDDLDGDWALDDFELDEGELGGDVEAEFVEGEGDVEMVNGLEGSDGGEAMDDSFVAGDSDSTSSGSGDVEGTPNGLPNVNGISDSGSDSEDGSSDASGSGSLDESEGSESS